MSTNQLDANLEVWNRKKLIRDIYASWYRKIESAMVPGRTLEIGGGFGNFKSRNHNTISTDIQRFGNLDCVADGQMLPFQTGSFSTIVLIDVIHHIASPTLFFKEAARVLIPGGRLCMIEPWVSPASWAIYRFLHQEAMVFTKDIEKSSIWQDDKDPFEGNLAMTNNLFPLNRNHHKGYQLWFHLRRIERFSFVAYPLSGGLSKPALYPTVLLPLLHSIEKLLGPLAALLAFRAFIVLQKNEK